MTTKHTYKSTSFINLKSSTASLKKTPVHVLNNDMLEIHRALALDESKKILTLNMANADKPGGQYNRQKHGILMGQEEYLFHNTNLANYLSTDMYPIKLNEVLLSQGVQTNDGLSIDIISCPAIDMRYIQHGTRLNRHIQSIMYKKIKTIFQVAQEHKYDILLLSALGCGGYCMPPEVISKLFLMVIGEFEGVFSKIVFAINSVDKHPKSNYNVFKTTMTRRNPN